MGIRKLRSVLCGNHPATVVYATFQDWVTWVKIILGFYVNNQPKQFPGAWSNGQETDIISDGSFCKSCIFIFCSSYHGSIGGVCLIR